MIPQLPLYISIVFMVITVLTVLMFCSAAPEMATPLVVLAAWLVILAVVALSGYYTETSSMPPRLIWVTSPALLVIILLFVTKRGLHFIEGFNVRTLTYLHVMRVLVELVLYWLYQNGKIPKLMTFTGWNWDILAGLSAPLVAYYGYTKNVLSKTVLLVWNLFALGLLLNVAILGLRSAPFPFQSLAFDQPNVAVLYFPFTWLPGCLVPIFAFAHLISIRSLLVKHARFYRY